MGAGRWLASARGRPAWTTAGRSISLAHAFGHGAAACRPGGISSARLILGRARAGRVSSLSYIPGDCLLAGVAEMLATEGEPVLHDGCHSHGRQATAAVGEDVEVVNVGLLDHAIHVSSMMMLNTSGAVPDYVWGNVTGDYR